jgi:DNA polymerase-3 subunit alpha
VVFPRDYEKWQHLLTEEARVFIVGRVSAEDDRASKLILENVKPFDELPVEVWVQFADRNAYAEAEQQLFSLLKSIPGEDSVAVYLKDVRAVKKLGISQRCNADETGLSLLKQYFGEDNVKVVQKAWRA